jgi:hypothetical protein
MMAKTGLAYYKMDTDRYQDIKIKRLKHAFGCNGLAVYDYVMCEIYRVKGCFLVWDESTVFDVADYFGLKETLVTEIINYCGFVGLFNKEVLTCERVITSLSIQSRYAEFCKISKRKSIEIPKLFLLIPEEYRKTPEEIGKTPEESTFTQEEIIQSKVKESKVKESKKNSEKFSPFDLAFNDFLEMRKKIRKPPTERAIELIMIELMKLSPDVDEQILILEQSIKNSWQGVFALKEDFKKEKSSAEKEKPSKIESNMNAVNEASFHLKELRSHDN